MYTENPYHTVQTNFKKKTKNTSNNWKQAFDRGWETPPPNQIPFLLPWDKMTSSKLRHLQLWDPGISMALRDTNYLQTK